jgi:hypothetical protein
MQVLKVNEWNEVPKNYIGIVEYFNGDKIWFLNSQQHREDGPAREWSNGEKEWWLNYKCLFRLLLKSQPFIIIEEFVDEKGEGKIKVLNQEGVKIWPNLPRLKECADNWTKP